MPKLRRWEGGCGAYCPKFRWPGETNGALFCWDKSFFRSFSPPLQDKRKQTYVHTYTNYWKLQQFSQETVSLFAPATVWCALICERCYLQINFEFEQQIWKLFLMTQSFCQKTAVRGLTKEIVFLHIFCFQIPDLKFELASLLLLGQRTTHQNDFESSNFP